MRTEKYGMSKEHGFFLSVFIFLIFITTSCNDDHQDPDSAMYNKITIAKKAEEQNFPLAPVEQNPGNQKKLSKATILNDFLPIVEMVPLEFTPDSILGQIQQVVFLDDSFFVLDKTQEQVYRFSRSGEFLKKIGRKGEGPGEYDIPLSMRKGFDGTIQIKDIRTRIHVFNANGSHRVSTRPGITEPPIFGTGAFIWDNQDTIHLAQFVTSIFSQPRHVTIKVEGTKYALKSSFGKRTQALGRLRYFQEYTGFQVISGRIWTADPESCEIPIYNLDGQFITKLVPPLGDEHIKVEDYDSSKLKTKSDIYKLTRNRKRNANLFVIGNYVFVLLSDSSFNVYDTNGNLLKTNLDARILPTMCGSFSNTGIFWMEALDSVDRYNPIVKELLKKNNWDPKTNPDANQFLLLGKLQ